MAIINLQQWLRNKEAKRRLKEFERIEKHLRLARVGLRKVRTNTAVQNNVYMVQDASRLLIDLQVYKRDVGVLPDSELQREVNRVRGGHRYANSFGGIPH